MHADSAIAAYAESLPQSALDPLRAQVPARRELWIEMIEGRDPRAPSVMVAEVEEDVAGSVVVAPAEPNGADARSVGRGSEPLRGSAMPGEGYGASLLHPATEELKTRGFAIGALWALDENAPARGMYERRGWRQDGSERVTGMGEGEAREIGYRISLGGADAGPVPGI